MMYSEKLAVAIKTNGKVLREFDTDKVYLPFGAEYSLFIKNLNSVRALVKISIDGRDVTGGGGVVVHANSSLDLERFLDNGNNNAGNKFKFIERNAAVEAGRGVGVEDGLIRIEYQFERLFLDKFWERKPDPWQTTPQWPWPYRWDTITYNSGHYTNNNANGLLGGTSTCGGLSSSAPTCDSIPMCDAGNRADSSIAANCASVNAYQNEAGITVEGAQSHQQFVTVSSFPLEAATHVMVFKLLGQHQTLTVTKPVTVKVKNKCKTCHHVAKATAKFCPQCGTGLQIVK